MSPQAINRFVNTELTGGQSFQNFLNIVSVQRSSIGIYARSVFAGRAEPAVYPPSASFS
jgi:hypothetical protein